MKTAFRPTVLIPLIVLAALLWFFRPWWHGFLMLAYTQPLFVVALFGIGWSLLKVAKAGYKLETYEKFGSAAVRIIPPTGGSVGRYVGLGLLSFVLMVAYLIIGTDFQYLQGFKSATYADAASLPATDQLRLVPFQVAERYGRDALQSPVEAPGEWHPQFWPGDDGKPRFSYVAARHPEGGIRYYFRKSSGVEVVRADATDRAVSFDNQELAASEGVGITDNIRWRIYKERYFVDVPEVFYAKVGSDLIAVAPVQGYRGWVVKYPVLEGAYFVYPDGRMEYKNAADAATHPAVVSAGRLYPEYLTRFYHEAYAYKGGLINKWFIHEDQIEISDASGESNRQPYMLSVTGGKLLWLSAADPYGNSYGVYKVFMTDAITGTISLYSLPVQSALTGASQSIGYVKSSNPQFNWSSDGSGGGNIVAVEPRPQVIKGELYWLTSVTTTESKGVNATCFLEAKSNKVRCFTSDTEARAFAAGNEVGTSPAVPVPAGTDPASEQRARIEKLEQLLQQMGDEIKALKQ